MKSRIMAVIAEIEDIHALAEIAGIDVLVSEELGFNQEQAARVSESTGIAFSVLDDLADKEEWYSTGDDE